VTAPASGATTVIARFTRWPDTAPAPTPDTTCRSDACDANELLPSSPPVFSATPTPDVFGSDPEPAAKLVGAWGKTLRFGSRVSVRAPQVSGAFTLSARVYVTRAGTIAQRGSAFKLTTTGGTVGTSTARLSIPRKRWTRVAMTFDGTTIRTYRNGKLVASRRHTGPLARTSQAFRLGGFKGRLRDVRLYDGALSY
jgi:hypothetical protein